MTYIKFGDTMYQATITGTTNDRSWDGRASKTITCTMTHAKAAKLFVANAEWSIIHHPDPYTDENGNTVTPNPVEYNNADYCVPGPITDNRDGTISVKMGKMTELEEAYNMLYGGDK